MAISNISETSIVLSCSATEIVDSIMARDVCALLFGAPGVGKSTLAAELGGALAAAGRDCWCLGADPGSPAFGLPGVISLAKWQNGDWRVCDSVAMCTLDAGRFRLPLITAVRQLRQQTLPGVVVIDAPGVVRGVAGKELLAALVDAAKVDVILALTAADRDPPLLDELNSVPTKLFILPAAQEAARPGKRLRDRQRTVEWDDWLKDSVIQQFDLGDLNIIGTPPPLDADIAWIGRQVALLQGHRTLVTGEVKQLDGQRLRVMLPHAVTGANTLLVRDVQRNAEGLIVTAAPFASEPINYLPPADVEIPHEKYMGPRLVARVGAVDLNLLNGVFGDPLLHVRVRHQRRSILFDLGDGFRLPARTAHQVTDVFISHAHLDHISGFLWLMRSRIGEFPPCRLYGPPGLARHIEGFLQGVLWDRVGDFGPGFEVTERHTHRLRRYFLQAGRPGSQLLEEKPIESDVLLNDSGFKVRAIMLDHRATPVMAYALEQDIQINIRKDRLVNHGLNSGPWLNELKQAMREGKTATMITLPDGSKQSVATLADELTLVSPGRKLVYATDLADSRDNRQRLVVFAQSAHTMFCEAAFSSADADHAERNGHLTTLACGEIAEAAGVARLVPFHFSQRYASHPWQMYEEISAQCNRVVVPEIMTDY